MEELHLGEYDATVLTEDKFFALYFEELLQYVEKPKSAANWMMGNVKGYINELAIDIEDFPVTPIRLAGLINMVDQGKMGQTMASQQRFPLLTEHTDQTAEQLAQRHGLVQVDDESELRGWIQSAMEKYPEKVEEYRGGKKGILGLFMGEVMRESRGKADPKKTNALIREALEQD
jgi:aspartyl-tRNA(Asn)/glutamyl-tRNA(Gln) amidotransferase subunit B